ncbi:hypothetical protein Mgra_00006302 [Meloidogyne graminicola]|uniref:Uncharacterized protein n=1 Tax=Meloidogyne graminicola TaxID=189291 RepID=A0A8S9ZMN1_9BILA|nr:hypothetical protein Mgra_00006302 [Meloidogyne graminicola]
MLNFLWYTSIVLLFVIYLIILFCAFVIGYVLNTHLRDEHKIEFFLDAVVVGDALYECWSFRRYLFED